MGQCVANTVHSFYARFAGLDAIIFQVSSSISSIYAEIGKSMPHDLQLRYTDFQVITRVRILLQSLHSGENLRYIAMVPC